MIASLKGLLERGRALAAAGYSVCREVHTLVGAGGASGTGDAANLLKPAARGATDYRRHHGANQSAILRKDPALTAFSGVADCRTGRIHAMEMVRGPVVDTLEKHHNILISG